LTIQNYIFEKYEILYNNCEFERRIYRYSRVYFFVFLAIPYRFTVFR